MIKRGKILRAANARPGLITIAEKKYAFTLENMWVSDVPPRPSRSVEVDYTDEGVLGSLRAMPESQLVKEQVDQALAEVKRQSADLTPKAAQFGASAVLIAVLGLVAGWFFLRTVSLESTQSAGLTFWRLLGFSNAGHAIATLEMESAAPSSAIWGLLAVATATPLLPYFWSDPVAHLGGVVPPLLMVAAFATLRSHLLDAGCTTGAWVGAGAADQLMSTMMAHLSVGLGLYVALACCLYFASIRVKRVLGATYAG